MNQWREKEWVPQKNVGSVLLTYHPCKIHFTLIGHYARWGSDRSVTDPGQFGRGEKQLTRLHDYVTENFSEAGPCLVVRLGPTRDCRKLIVRLGPARKRRAKLV